MRPAVVVAIVAGMGVAVAVAMSTREVKTPTLGAPPTSASPAPNGRSPLDDSADPQATAAPAAPTVDKAAPCDSALSCMAAGHTEAALESALAADQPALACVAAALQGRDDVAAGAGGASARCLSARTWQLVARGKTDEALVVSAALEAGPGLLARAEALWAAGLVDDAMAAAVAGAAQTPDPTAVPARLVRSLLARMAARRALTPGDPMVHRVQGALDALAAAQPSDEDAIRRSEAWVAASP